MTADQKTIEETIAVFGDRAGQLIKLTLKDADLFVSHIEKAVEDQDMEAVMLAAHSLKSVMRQIGASEVADTSGDIEQAAKNGDIQPCSDKLSALQSRYHSTKSFLETLCS